MDGIDALAIANTVREPLLVLDSELVVRFANDAFPRRLGVGPDRTVGRSIWAVGDGQLSHPDLRRLLEEVLPAHSRFDDFRLEHDFGAVGRRVLLLNASEIVVQGAADRWILLAMEDVTERLAAEAALAERTRELERFTLVASHDLQEPLRKIRTYGALLTDTCGAELGDDGREYIARMSGAAARMQGLIDDLLTLARTANTPLQHVRVSLAEVVREVVVDLEVTLVDAAATVDVGSLPVVWADPVHLRQLFQNLLSNAVKFRRPGVPLRVAIEARRSEQGSAGHEIVVRDNGIGFDDRYARTIFDPFERLHGRHEYAGNGIGLAICQRIVERHGGRIAAYGVPGEGATITVALPSARAPHAPAVASHLPTLA